MFAQRPITECPTNPSCALLAYPRNTQHASSPRTLQCGPMADARIGPPSTWVFAPTQSGASSREPERTSTPLPSTTGPWRTSKTTPGSTAASGTTTHAGSPSTVLPAGIGSLSPSRSASCSASCRSSVRISSYAPCSTTPDTSTLAALACGPSQVAPAPTPQPTVTPWQVRRNAAGGNGGARPRGTNVDDPSNAGPVTGCRTRTTGAPGSTNPARWGRAKTAVVSVAANASRSEEHTSELQSQSNLVCRLLLEKKKKVNDKHRKHL